MTFSCFSLLFWYQWVPTGGLWVLFSAFLWLSFLDSKDRPKDFGNLLQISTKNKKKEIGSDQFNQNGIWCCLPFCWWVFELALILFHFGGIIRLLDINWKSPQKVPSTWFFKHPFGIGREIGGQGRMKETQLEMNRKIEINVKLLWYTNHYRRSNN